MSSKLILKKIKAFNLDEKNVIVMEDFNSELADTPLQIFRKMLNDPLENSEVPFYRPKGTFNSFDSTSIVERRIDYILTKNLKIKSYRPIDDRSKNNLYMSDHLPVFVTIKETINND